MKALIPNPHLASPVYADALHPPGRLKELLPKERRVMKSQFSLKMD